MSMDLDDSTVYLARMKASAQQRKLSIEARDGVPNPNQEKTLLLREVDTMTEDDILQLFLPQFKDTIESIRLFPPIPGTRGFAFIEFADAMTAIRAFALRHRTTFTYRGAPKKVFLSRVTGFKQEDEMKWKKYQERQDRNQGRSEYDSTPRKLTFKQSVGQPVRPGDLADSSKATSGSVQTVPFSEIQNARTQSSEGGGGPDDREGYQAARGDKPEGSGYAAEEGNGSGGRSTQRADDPHSSSASSGRRDRESSDSTTRKRDYSPPRRSSPKRDRFSFAEPRSQDAVSSRGDDRYGDRRPYDSRDRRYGGDGDRNSQSGDRAGQERDSYRDEQDRSSYPASRGSMDRRSFDDDRRGSGRDSREGSYDDRKRRRIDEDDRHNSSSDKRSYR